MIKALPWSPCSPCSLWSPTSWQLFICKFEHLTSRSSGTSSASPANLTGLATEKPEIMVKNEQWIASNCKHLILFGSDPRCRLETSCSTVVSDLVMWVPRTLSTLASRTSKRFRTEVVTAFWSKRKTNSCSDCSLRSPVFSSDCCLKCRLVIPEKWKLEGILDRVCKEAGCLSCNLFIRRIMSCQTCDTDWSIWLGKKTNLKIVQGSKVLYCKPPQNRRGYEGRGQMSWSSS